MHLKAYNLYYIRWKSLLAKGLPTLIVVSGYWKSPSCIQFPEETSARDRSGQARPKLRRRDCVETERAKSPCTSTQSNMAFW